MDEDVEEGRRRDLSGEVREVRVSYGARNPNEKSNVKTLFDKKSIIFHLHLGSGSFLGKCAWMTRFRPAPS
jgi:hypothetical protein